MKVRVQISSILYRGRETTEFYVFGRRISLRNEDFKFGKKNTIIIEKSLAEKNRMRWKLLFHFPPYIQPVYNQTCIDELKFRTTQGS